jgi:hypothetical protein
MSFRSAPRPANRITYLVIGGFQLSTVVNWAGGLPFTLGYDQFNISGTGNPEDCYHSTGGTAAPCFPNVTGHMKTALTSFSPKTSSRNFFTAQPRSDCIVSWPGLDTIGNAGYNSYRGPSFFNTDLGIVKAFTIHEGIAAKFRMDAFNPFNHINAGNPGNTDVFGSATTPTGTPIGDINGEAAGAAPRQLEFSMRVQF